MGCDEQVRAEQRACTHIFDEVVVPTDQDRHSKAPGRVEHRKGFAARDALVFEGVELAVPFDLAVRQRDDVGVVEAPTLIPLDQAGADSEPAALREASQGLNGSAIRHGLGDPSIAVLLRFGRALNARRRGRFHHTVHRRGRRLGVL
jgi:hypothetical protein